MKQINSLHLHNYFCGSYKRYRSESYDPRGKGLEMILLKRLLKSYDPYQIMAAMDYANESFVDITINIFYNRAMQIIEDIAFDPLLARARYALRKLAKRNPDRDKLLRTMEWYIDEQDAWFPSRTSQKLATAQLEEMVEEIL